MLMVKNKIQRAQSPLDYQEKGFEIMKNYLFYDEETGEHFFVQDESLWKANETAHKYFKRPFFIDEMDDAEAEICGYDTY